MFQSSSIDFTPKVIWRSHFNPRGDLDLEIDVAIEIAIQGNPHDQRYKALVSILVSRPFRGQGCPKGDPDINENAAIAITMSDNLYTHDITFTIHVHWKL